MLALAAGLVAGVAWLVVYRHWLARRLAGISAGRLVLAAAAFWFCGSILAFALPSLPINYLLIPKHNLVVTVREPGGALHPGRMALLWFNSGLQDESFDGLQKQGEWRRTETGLELAGEPPAELHWVGRAGGEAVLQFHSGPDAGVLEVSWDGAPPEVIDLFNEFETSRALRRDFPIPWGNTLSSALIVGGCVGSLLFLLVFLWVARDAPGPAAEENAFVRRGWPGNIPSALLIVTGTAYFIMYLWMAFIRLPYPYELDFVESGLMDTVQRVLDGLPLFTPPTLSYTPALYTPFYYYAAVPFAWLLGCSFPALRVLSFLASLAAIGLVGLLAWNETGNWRPACISSGLFVATFAAGGAWFDTARVDSLYLAFLLGGIYFLRRNRRRFHLLIAACLFLLAFWTKQTGLGVAILASLYSIVAIKGQRKWIFPAITLAGSGILTGIAHMRSGGWFTYYVFRMPNHHPAEYDQMGLFLSRDIFHALPLAALAGVFVFLLWLARRQIPSAFHLVLVLGGVVGLSAVNRLHEGGYLNTLIPAFAVLSVLFGVGLEMALRIARTGRVGGITIHTGRAALLLTLLGLLQFGLLAYDPRQYLPSAADRKAGDELVSWMKQVQGDIFLPNHTTLTDMAGKPTHAHLGMMWDIFRADDPNANQTLAPLKQEILTALETRRFEAVILDDTEQTMLLDFYKPFMQTLEENYTYLKPAIPGGGLIPVVGYKTRPHSIYIRSDHIEAYR